MYYKQETGRFGEDEVEKYLTENNYKIMVRNFRCNFGEIDVVARDLDKNEIVFIEVKTRKSKTYGDASEAIDYYKKKHIIKSAEYFVWINRLENEYIRIDVIEVYLGKNSKPRINHIKQAFY